MPKCEVVPILSCTGCGALSMPLDLAHADGVCPICGAAATVPTLAAVPVLA